MASVPFPHKEEVAALASFEDISCVQPDGKTQFCKCKKCDLITTKSTFNMWRHWKYACPYKLLFKYNSSTLNPNRSGSDMTVICLVCHDQFEQKSISFMTTHRKHCKSRIIPSADVQQVQATVESNNADSAVIVEPHDVDVSTESDNTVQHPTKSASSYRMEPLSDLNQLRFSIKKTNQPDEKKAPNCAEHQSCENQLDTNSKNISRARPQGEKIPSENDNVLFCVYTDPNPNENTQEQLDISVNSVDNKQNDSPATPDGNPNCFICNSSTSAPFVDLYGTETNHSKTSIYSFVWKLLGGRPSTRNDSVDASCLKGDVVCAECLDMINEYDRARLNVKRYKKHLRERLIRTEAHFENLQNDESRQIADDNIDDTDRESPDLAHVQHLNHDDEIIEL